MMAAACAVLAAVPGAVARPLSTEEWCPAGPGSFAFEAGQDNVFDRYGGMSKTSLFTAVYGLSGTTEFAADFPREETVTDDGREVSGMADISLHLKHCVFRETGPWPGVAVKSTVKLATGSRGDGLGSGDEDVGFALMVSRSRDDINLRVMAGYVFAGNRYDPSRENFIRYGAGFTVSLFQKGGIFAEAYGESCNGHAAGRWDRHLLRPLAGAMYEINGAVSVDAAVYAEFSEGGLSGRGFTAGVTLAFQPAGVFERNDDAVR
jgi:hypothetical protein